jgi:hypothetical protein
MWGFLAFVIPAAQEHLNATQAEAANLHRANQELARQLAEATCLRRESED